MYYVIAFGCMLFSLYFLHFTDLKIRVSYNFSQLSYVSNCDCLSLSYKLIRSQSSIKVVPRKIVVLNFLWQAGSAWRVHGACLKSRKMMMLFSSRKWQSVCRFNCCFRQQTKSDDSPQHACRSEPWRRQRAAIYGLLSLLATMYGGFVLLLAKK